MALDIHGEYMAVGAWNADEEWALTPRRISMEKFPEWAKKNIRNWDIVVLETTTNVWATYSRNRLQSLHHKHNPKFSEAGLLDQVWWEAQEKISPLEKMQIRQELVWYVLTRRQPYRHFSQEDIAYKYLTWAWQMDEAPRDRLTRQQFPRYYMTLEPPARAGVRLGIGQDLQRIALNPKYPHRLASEAELLVLRPESNHIE